MILRFIILVVVLVGIYYFLNYYKNQPAAKRKETLTRSILYFIAGLLILLVLTGRISWVFAVIGAALPWINRFATAHQIWRTFKQKSEPKTDSNKPKGKGGMTLEQAYKILAIDETASRKEVLAAHRKQMQNNHPDRGGSDFLAQQINLARDIILENLNQ